MSIQLIDYVDICLLNCTDVQIRIIPPPELEGGQYRVKFPPLLPFAPKPHRLSATKL